MSHPVSRENEPSAFAWIFGAVLGAAGLGAAIWGATKGRTGHLGRVERSDHEVTANAQQPSWGSMPDA